MTCRRRESRPCRITAIRWRGLLRAQGEDVPFSTLFWSLIAGCFVRQFLPSTVGGDTVRAYYSTRAGVKPETSIVAVVVDRLIGLLALIIVAGIALTTSDALSPWSEVKYGFLAAAAIILLTSWIVFVPTPRLIGALNRILEWLPARIQALASRVLRAGTAYQGKLGVVFRSLCWSFVLQVNVVTFYFLISLALDLQVGYDKFFIIAPASVIVMLLPISINGIGIREAVFVTLLGAFGVPESGAIAFAFLEYGSVLLIGVVGGFVLLWGRSHEPAARYTRPSNETPTA